ncbi:MAG: hypothetical protein NXH88_11300 [Hyphomonas sp.]|nr:hypothetical protein [Hyphomonas sp.]
MRGHLVFTPSGSASGWWRFSFIPVALTISGFPIFVFVLTGTPELHNVDDHSLMAPLFAVPIFILLVLICGFALAYALVSICRFVRARWRHRNE